MGEICPGCEREFKRRAVKRKYAIKNWAVDKATIVSLYASTIIGMSSFFSLMIPEESLFFTNPNKNVPIVREYNDTKEALAKISSERNQFDYDIRYKKYGEPVANHLKAARNSLNNEARELETRLSSVQGNIHVREYNDWNRRGRNFEWLGLLGAVGLFFGGVIGGVYYSTKLEDKKEEELKKIDKEGFESMMSCSEKRYSNDLISS